MKLTFCDENDESSDDFAQTSFLNTLKSLFFESERISINFTKKMFFGHILAVEVLLPEIGQNKKLIIIKIVKNRACKCLQLY